jgi:hypothetical protein
MFNNAKASNKAIKGLIASIARQNKTLRLKIHTALCRISAHAYEHGDVTMFTYLLDNVRGQDRKAIVDWIEVYGFAKFKSDGTFSLNKAMRDNSTVADGQALFDDYTHEDSEVKPWFNFVKSVKQIAKDMTLDQMILALVARSAPNLDDSADLKGKPRATVVKESTLGGLNNAIAQLQTLADNPKVVPLKAVA